MATLFGSNFIKLILFTDYDLFTASDFKSERGSAGTTGCTGFDPCFIGTWQMVGRVFTGALPTVVVFIPRLTALIFADDLISTVQDLDLILSGAVMAADRGPGPSDSTILIGCWSTGSGRSAGGESWTTVGTRCRGWVGSHPTFTLVTHVVTIGGFTFSVSGTVAITFIGTSGRRSITPKTTVSSTTNVSSVSCLTLSCRGTATITCVGDSRWAWTG